MTNFFTVEKSISDLRTDFPHTPDDSALSVLEFLEDKLALGYRFIGTTGHYGGTGPIVWVFQVVAK